LKFTKKVAGIKYMEGDLGLIGINFLSFNIPFTGNKGLLSKR